MTDIDLGVFTARLEQARSVCVTSDKSLIRYHGYEDVTIEDFVRGLLKANIRRREKTDILDVHLDPADRSVALQRLSQALGKRVKTKMKK